MKVSTEHKAIITNMGEAYLAKHGYTFADVVTGADAWRVLHNSGAYRAIGDQYPGGYPDYSDGHFQTALAAVMPNAVFRDAKRY
jgi:hypothetical protein